MSTITALAPWFGSKRTMASDIVEALGPHSVYWEPFCGSMAVLLCKNACSVEVVNDLHDDVINLPWPDAGRDGPRSLFGDD
jgi:DNA adenine methylase